MTPTSSERQIRALLPVIRYLQAYLPLPWLKWLDKRSLVHVRLPADVTRKTVTVDGVPCEWLIPQNSPSHQVLLYLHGGGFVYGLTSQHLEMVAYLAQRMGFPALLVDYRLAPEHPFPAALDDSVIVYRWLLKQGYPAQKIVVAGDSAGGNLTITLMMKLRDNGEELPAAVACLSPVANLSNQNTSRETFKDPMLHPKAIRMYYTSYVAHNEARNPLISPVFGDLHGLPPLLIHVGEDEILRDDAVCINELAKAAGVDAQLEIYPRMWHVWQLFLTMPQAVRSLDNIAEFLKSPIENSSR